MFRVIDRRSPAVSPRVVAEIFITQNAAAILGSLLSASLAIPSSITPVAAVYLSFANLSSGADGMSILGEHSRESSGSSKGFLSQGPHITGRAE